jgi:transcriptional regulator with XRE-family HTH domain
MPTEQPTLARRTLGLAFRRHRKEQGKTIEEAAAAIGYSGNTVARIEKGEQPTRFSQARDLCDFYQLPPAEKSRLCGLATQSSEPGWWEPYFDKTRGAAVQPRSPLFLETERSARRIWVLELEVVPGLLQTMEYLRALQAAGLPTPEEDPDAAQGLRAHRQIGLDGRDDGPELEFILGYAVMHHLEQLPAEIRDGQLERIHQVAARPNVTVRVIQRLHAATAGSFTILEPGDDLPPFVFVDAGDGCRYVEDRDVVSLYERMFIAARDSTEII